MELTVELREQFGTNVSNKLRREGKIPAVVYGGGKETQHILLNGKAFQAFLRGHERVIKFKLPGAKKQEDFLIKDVQYDFLGEEVNHVDFIRFDANVSLLFKIPLEFIGTPEGSKEGGVLETQLKELTIETTPKDAPEKIAVRVMHLKLNDVLKVKDVKLPENTKISGHEPEDIVAQVKTPVEREEAEIDASMPEVITAKKEDKEEGDK